MDRVCEAGYVGESNSYEAKSCMLRSRAHILSGGTGGMHTGHVIQGGTSKFLFPSLFPSDLDLIIHEVTPDLLRVVERKRAR